MPSFFARLLGLMEENTRLLVGAFSSSDDELSVVLGIQIVEIPAISGDGWRSRSFRERGSKIVVMLWSDLRRARDAAGDARVLWNGI